MIIVVIRNVTTTKIVNRFVKEINVIWNATGKLVHRNVRKMPENVVCNVTVKNSVSSLQEK